MSTLTLVVDQRELSTIQAALLLLQEQINALPEDLAEMIGEHGAPMTEEEIGNLSGRILTCQGRAETDQLTRSETLVEIERAAAPLTVLGAGA
jgi:hypothetical protein